MIEYPQETKRRTVRRENGQEETEMKSALITGAASGIFKAADPYKMAEDMIAAVRKAIDDRKANGLD